MYVIKIHNVKPNITVDVSGYKWKGIDT